MSSQISNHHEGHLIFKCHFNKIYFVFPKVSISLTLFMENMSVSGNISSTIPKGILVAENPYHDVEQFMMCSKLCKNIE